MLKRIVTVLFLILTIVCVGFAQNESNAKKAEIVKPKPDISNGKYGEFERNTFDLWKPKSKKTTPLVVYIHGGGLTTGDKEKISANQLEAMLKAGFAVMAINYRLTPEAVFPQHYMDAARAIQFARYHAKDFNIDPKRVAATGSSAGGMTSLWIGFHDDLADPKNSDPVLRESTRLKAMAVSSAQTTLVPELVKKYIGVLATQYQTYNNGKIFGLKKEEMTSPKGFAALYGHFPDDLFNQRRSAGLGVLQRSEYAFDRKSTTSDAIHHPGFGTVLKEEMDKLKIECKIRHKDDGQNVNGDMVNFLAKYLK